MKKGRIKRERQFIAVLMTPDIVNRSHKEDGDYAAFVGSYKHEAVEKALRAKQK